MKNKRTKYKNKRIENSYHWTVTVLSVSILLLFCELYRSYLRVANYKLSLVKHSSSNQDSSVFEASKALCVLYAILHFKIFYMHKNPSNVNILNL